MNKPCFYQREDQSPVLWMLGIREGEFQCLQEVVANTKEAAVEKHIPVVSENGEGLSVKVGSVSHPMTPGHYIEWIVVETKDGGMYRRFMPEEAPEAVFPIKRSAVTGVYAYCNLHGLWKAEQGAV